VTAPPRILDRAVRDLRAARVHLPSDAWRNRNARGSYRATSCGASGAPRVARRGDVSRRHIVLAEHAVVLLHRPRAVLRRDFRPMAPAGRDDALAARSRLVSQRLPAQHEPPDTLLPRAVLLRAADGVNPGACEALGRCGTLRDV
jgi:hypothetical protein